MVINLTEVKYSAKEVIIKEEFLFYGQWHNLQVFFLSIKQSCNTVRQARRQTVKNYPLNWQNF